MACKAITPITLSEEEMRQLLAMDPRKERMRMTFVIARLIKALTDAIDDLVEMQRQLDPVYSAELLLKMKGHALPGPRSPLHRVVDLLEKKLFPDGLPGSPTKAEPSAGESAGVE